MPRLMPFDPESAADPRDGTMANYARDICATESAKPGPDVLVFFAGRHAALGTLLADLDSSNCKPGRVEILTGDDASLLQTPGAGFPDNAIRQALDQVVELDYAALTDEKQWKAAGLPEPSRLSELRATLDDTFHTAVGEEAIMGYDAMTATIYAEASTQGSEVIGHPTRWSSFACPSSAIPGASGVLAFQGDGNPEDKAMPIMRKWSDHAQAMTVAWPLGKPRYESGSTTCSP
jgi:hypothetical protein